jgi:hypothetical protein
MGVDFATLDYLPNYDMFARPVVFTPVVSQPNAAAYEARGVFSTRTIDIAAEDGSIISDQQTILDILEMEFAVVPQQRDLVTIPADGSIPAVGDFEVTNTWTDGGGETTLTLRAIYTEP